MLPAPCSAALLLVTAGDHPITAKAIAYEIGIIDDEHIKANTATVCTGDDIRAIMDIEDEEQRTAAWDKVLAHEQIVFARVTPAHKLLIVENNQRHGHIVAVTGGAATLGRAESFSAHAGLAPKACS